MEDSKRYEIRKYAVALTAFAIDVILLIYALASGLTFRLRDFASSVSASPWMAVFVYVAVLSGVMKLVHLPLSFYSSYIVEHQFGLSRLTLRRWLRDQIVGLAVGFPLAVAAAEVVYYLIRAAPERWWAYAATAFVAFAVGMANLAPVVLLPLFFKFKPVEDSGLQRRLERLARRTQTRLCGVFEWSLGEKTRKANAAVVGWGNTRRIIVSDTLLANFTPEEIEVIMAHELCHHVKRHIWQAIAIQSALAFLGFYLVAAALGRFSDAFGFAGPADIANLPFMLLIASALSAIALPGLNWFSRRLETDADRYALDVTGDSLAFVSGMEKLARLNLARVSPNRIIEFIFYSHPSIEKRIRMAADRVGQSA